MKSIKEIENMSLEQLEAVSMDESIVVPKDFNDHLSETLMAKQAVDLLLEDEKLSRRRIIHRAAGAAAAVALIAGVGVISVSQNRPKDTFDDPYLAYAQMQKAFDRISDGLERGLAMAEDSQQTIDRATAVFSE